MRYLYLITGTCLLFAGIGTFLAQLYLWLAHQTWTPAPFSLFLELAQARSVNYRWPRGVYAL